MTESSARPDAELLYILALRLSPLLEPGESTRIALESCATLAGCEVGMLLTADLPPAAVGMPVPGPDAAAVICTVPAVRAAMQMLGVTALPAGVVPLPGKALIAGSIPNSDGMPGVLLLGRSTPLDRATRLTLSAAMPLIGQTLDRSRRHRQQYGDSVTNDDIVSRLAHDIRSPLVATHASIEVVQRLLHGHNAVPAPIFSALATGLQSIQSAVELCNDMLEVSRLKHKIVLAPRPVSVERLLTDTNQILRSLADQRGIHIDICLPDAPLYILGDERLLRRMLTNLVGNGLRFAPAGGFVRIEALADVEAATVLLRVSDNGPGIPESERERIFAPFAQGSGEAGRGTGLGLTLCREVTQAHGGRIWIEDRVGGGTLFQVVLPAAL